MNANDANPLQQNLANNASDVNGVNNANDTNDANKQVNSDNIMRIIQIVTPQIVNGNSYEDSLFNGIEFYGEDNFESPTFPSTFP